MDYYSVLDVPRSADHVQIHRAFRIKVRRYHPDMGASASPERFREVVEAYEVLSDPSRRQHYDESLRPRPIRVEPMVAPREPEPMVEYFYSSSRTADPFSQMLPDPFDLIEAMLAEFDSCFDAFFWH